MGHRGSYSISKSNGNDYIDNCRIMICYTGCSEIIVSYIKVRLAQCVRKLGRVKEAIKIYREVCSEEMHYYILQYLLSQAV